MDAIDEVRARLSMLETRLLNVDGIAQSAISQITSSQAQVMMLDQEIRSLRAQMMMLEVGISAAHSEAAVIQSNVLRLVNQVAIVSATLGSAIQALKQGDANASSAALDDALSTQMRLGSMLNDLGGRPK